MAMARRTAFWARRGRGTTISAPGAASVLSRERVRELMTSVARLDVPLEVEAGAGRNWEQAH